MMKLSYLANALYILAVLFLAFAAGIGVSLTQVWPYPIFHDAYKAGMAEWSQSQAAVNPLATDLWRRARTNARGVTMHDAAKMQPGYTLFTSGDGNVARLIDADGHVIHEWKMPFSKVWTKNAAVQNPQKDDLIYMRRAKLLPNGHLLAIYISGNDTPWGYGLVELDADSHIVWRYLAHVHHDLDIANDGRIVTLTHNFTNQPLSGYGFVPTPYLEDFLVTLSPDGKQLSKLSLTQMLARSPYGVSLRRGEPWFADFDPLHVNTVDWLGPKDIKALGFGKPGDVLVMFRQINLLALVDPTAKRIVWGMHGNWLAPHDPHVLANGNILMFDNLGNMKPHNPSRVIEFNPHNDQITWSYQGPKNDPLNSRIRATDQRLANGDTLITDSDSGRLLEVSKAGRIVWEYVSPIRAGANDEFIPVLSGGYRIDPASLDPAFRKQLAAKEQQVASQKTGS
ncbi:MAG: arylsulfotransferase family protein [Salinisphaera sp.]|uniref:arylsulfotransferase family protein n=1 Tax=Salinisphaera sp. TaxID=1914330 RepID=UPI003C7BD1E8